MEFSGTITGDARVSKVKGDKEVVNFSVAMNERYKPKDSTEYKQRTVYIDVAWWRGTKIASILKKGAVVTVSGWLFPSAYVNMSGNAVGKIHCNASTIELLKGVKTSQQPVKKETEPGDLSEPLDDLPF